MYNLHLTHVVQRSYIPKVTVEDILNVEAEYRGSEEERNDVLRYYEEGEVRPRLQLNCAQPYPTAVSSWHIPKLPQTQMFSISLWLVVHS